MVLGAPERPDSMKLAGTTGSVAGGISRHLWRPTLRIPSSIKPHLFRAGARSLPPLLAAVMTVLVAGESVAAGEGGSGERMSGRERVYGHTMNAWSSFTLKMRLTLFTFVLIYIQIHQGSVASNFPLIAKDHLFKVALPFKAEPRHVCVSTKYSPGLRTTPTCVVM